MTTYPCSTRAVEKYGNVCLIELAHTQLSKDPRVCVCVCAHTTRLQQEERERTKLSSYLSTTPVLFR